MKPSDRPMSIGELMDKAVHITVVHALPILGITGVAVLLAAVFQLLASLEPQPPPSAWNIVLPRWSAPIWFGFFAQFVLYSLGLAAALFYLDGIDRGISLRLRDAYTLAFSRWPQAALGLGLCLAIALATFVVLSNVVSAIPAILRALAVVEAQDEPSLSVAGALISFVLLAVVASLAARFVIAGAMCFASIVIDKTGFFQGVFFGLRSVASGGGQFWRMLGAGTTLLAMLVLVSVVARAIAAFVPLGNYAFDGAIFLESIGYLVVLTITAVFTKLLYADIRLRGVPLSRPQLSLKLDPQVDSAFGQDERDR